MNSCSTVSISFCEDYLLVKPCLVGSEGDVHAFVGANEYLCLKVVYDCV